MTAPRCLLALDTAEDACSAALYLEGEVHQRFVVAPRQHSELLLQMLDGLLQEAGLRPTQLDGLAFGRGPGSFTGVRIAAAVAQGVALGADLPVLPVSSLCALAHGVWRRHGEHEVLALLDARMGEVYAGAWRVTARGEAQALGEEQVIAPAALALPPGDQAWCPAGSGWTAYAELLRDRFGARLRPLASGEVWVEAEDVAWLGAAALAAGQGLDAAAALPVYLRNEVTWKKSAPAAAKVG